MSVNVPGASLGGIGMGKRKSGQSGAVITRTSAGAGSGSDVTGKLRQIQPVQSRGTIRRYGASLNAQPTRVAPCRSSTDPAVSSSSPDASGIIIVLTIAWGFFALIRLSMTLYRAMGAPAGDHIP